MSDFENFTKREEAIRDALLGKLMNQILPPWVHPIHISFFRYFLLIVALGFYLLFLDLPLTIILLALIGVLDALDGPLARVRGQETKIGAWLDHVGDWILGVFLGILVLINQLLSLILIVLIVIPQLIIVAISFLTRPKITQVKFKPSFFSRVQFFLVISSFCFLLASVAWERVFFAHIGYLLLYGEILVAWFLSLGKLFSFKPLSH